MYSLKFNASCSNGKNVWMITSDNGIFEFDIEDTKVKCRKSIFMNSLGIYNRFSLLVYWNNSLIMAPYDSGCFFIYDLKKDEIRELMGTKVGIAFVNYYITDKRILFFSKDCKVIAVYEKDLELINFIDTAIKTKEQEKNIGCVIHNGICLYKDCFYIVVPGTNELVSVSLYTLKIVKTGIVKRKIEMAQSDIVTVFEQNDIFYYLLLDGSIYTGTPYKMEEKIDLPENYERGNMGLYPYNNCIQNGDCTIILPYEANMALMLKNNEVTECVGSKDRQDSLGRKGYLAGTDVASGKIIFFQAQSGEIVVVDTKTGLSKVQVLDYSDGTIMNYFEEFVQKGSVLYEDTSGMKLKDYVEYIMKRKVSSVCVEKTEICGQRIYMDAIG